LTQATLSLGDTPPAANALGEFAHLPLERVWADPDQPRKQFDEAFVAQLAESIKAQGVIQPIVVRPTSAAEATYTIISGESRWRASQLAGKETIPALIRRDLTDADIAVMQILENLQRRDLTLIETCEGVTRLVREIGFEKATEQLGMSKSWVSRHSTLGELPPEVLALVQRGQVESIEMAKDLAQLVSLNPKGGAIAVGRLAGTHAHYGQLLHRPPLTAEQLETYTPEQIAEDQQWRENESRPITRVELRAQLNNARREQAIKDRAVEERKANRHDPAAKAEREAAKQKAEKSKADNQRRDDFKKQAEAFEQTHTATLCQALGLKAPKRPTHGWDWREPVVVKCATSLYPGCTAPAKFDNLDFKLDFTDVEPALLRKAHAAGFTLKVAAIIEHDAYITLEQAEALFKILGPKQLKLGTEIACKAHEVAAFVARFAKSNAPAKPKPASTSRTMTSIEQFLLSDAVVEKEGARLKASDLHAAYSRWCKKNKLTPLSLRDNAFGAAITAEGFESKRSNGIVYLGIEVLS
jgi:ParB/RepB/Spo0J family partition protein